MNTNRHWITAFLFVFGCVLTHPAWGAQPETGADTGFKWWWEDEEADQPGEEEETPWMITSPFANVTWPEIKMPRISLLPSWSDEEGEAGTTWTTPFSRAKAATRGAIDRTRTAWNSAVERMKFAIPGGEQPESTQLADAEPSFWERMFGRDEPDTGPSSVGDLMANEPDRDPSRIRR